MRDYLLTNGWLLENSFKDDYMDIASEIRLIIIESGMESKFRHAQLREDSLPMRLMIHYV